MSKVRTTNDLEESRARGILDLRLLDGLIEGMDEVDVDDGGDGVEAAGECAAKGRHRLMDPGAGKPVLYLRPAL